MVSIEELKAAKREKKMTLDELSAASGIAKRTLEDIFRGATKAPRVDTIQAIERALGLDGEKEKAPAPELTVGERELFELISQLTEQEIDELSNFVDFILSKRK